MTKGNKIIKVSPDLKLTSHDFPEGSIQEQMQKLYALIGNGCDIIQNVMPRRLYTKLGHTSNAEKESGKCVSMLVDEEFFFRNGCKPNAIGSYLYETDKHGSPILGNILFVGNWKQKDGIAIGGIEEETFEILSRQLDNIIEMMKPEKQQEGGNAR